MDATIFAFLVGLVVSLFIIGMHLVSQVYRVRSNSIGPKVDLSLKERLERGTYRENGILKWDSNEEVVDPLDLVKAGIDPTVGQVAAFNHGRAPRGMMVAVRPVVHPAVAEAERILSRIWVKTA